MEIPHVGMIFEDAIDGQRYQVTAVCHDGHASLGNRVETVGLDSSFKNEGFVIYEEEYGNYRRS